MLTQITFQNVSQLDLQIGELVIIKFQSNKYGINREFTSTIDSFTGDSRFPIKLTSSYVFWGEEYTAF